MKEEIKIFLLFLLVGLGFVFSTLDEYSDLYRQYFIFTDNIAQSEYYKKYSEIKNSIKSSINNFIDENEIYLSDNIITDNSEVLIPTITPTQIIIENLELPLKVQLIGDSMMLEGFGPRMEYKLELIQGLTVFRNGKYSTGLNRIDYFNWYKESENLINKNSPDVLIVIFGGNDGQAIIDLDSGIKYKFGHEKWYEIYSKRVRKYLNENSSKVKQIYWVGQTIPRTDEFYRKFVLFNEIYKKECEKFTNCFYVDEWARFSVNGKYSPTLANDQGIVKVVKGSDGVHVTTHGGDIMADEVIKIMKLNIDFE